MTIHVLFINSQLAFTVSIKQALERTGAFEVHPFTTPEAALDYLQGHVQDVALIDFNLLGSSSGNFVRQLREVQPNISIIATPRQSDDVIAALELQGSAIVPFSARDIIPLLQQAVEGVRSEPGEPSDSKGRSGLLTRVLGGEEQPRQLAVTKRAKSKPPDDLPEYTSLENVLASAARSDMFSQLGADEDSDALPEDLWGSDSSQSRPAGSFDEVLNALDPDVAERLEKRDADEFANLVNSMRGSEAQKPPLPARQQQYVEFILSGGMDNLLEEIERSQTDMLSSPEEEQPAELSEAQAPEISTFEQLQRDEPPSPSFEESGTVGDLITGVTDTSFRSVLSILRGDEPPIEPAAAAEAFDEPEPAEPEAEAEDAFASFFEPPTADAEVAEATRLHQQDDDRFDENALFGDETRVSSRIYPEPQQTVARPTAQFDFDAFDLPSEEEEDIPARVILETALDESAPAESFSIDSLIANIEDQLPAYKPKVYPLPSWLSAGQKTQEMRPVRAEDDTDRFVREPDFLPDVLPEFDQVPQAQFEAPAEVEPDYTGQFADQATVVSAAAAAEIEEFPQDLETAWLDLIGPEDALAEPSAEAPVAESVFDFGDSEPEYGTGEEQPFRTFIDETPVLDRDTFEAVSSGVDEMAEPEAEIGAPEDLEPLEAEPVESFAASDFDFEIEPQAEAAEDVFDWFEAEDSAEAEVEAPLPEAEIEEAFTFEAPAAEAVAETEPEADAEFESIYDDLPEVSEWDFDTDFEMLAAFDIMEEPELAAAQAELDAVASTLSQPPSDDPRIAQLALSLTQSSLELTAEATLLSRAGQIVAYAGELDRETIEELRAAIGDDWDTTSDEVRIRFVTLEGSGRDYMLYARRTDDDLTLSLIFAGTTPLRDIRRQGKRLIEALQAVPETPAPPAQIVYEMPPLEQERETTSQILATGAPVEAGVFNAHTFVWLLRDPNAQLGSAAAQAIVAGLNVQLREQGWQIQTLEAREDHLYLMADVPGDTPSHEVIRDLKRRSAEIAHTQEPVVNADDLWADGYLVVTPGRALDEEEIQQFINFERMP